IEADRSDGGVAKMDLEEAAVELDQRSERLVRIVSGGGDRGGAEVGRRHLADSELGGPGAEGAAIGGERRSIEAAVAGGGVAGDHDAVEADGQLEVARSGGEAGDR